MARVLLTSLVLALPLVSVAAGQSGGVPQAAVAAVAPSLDAVNGAQADRGRVAYARACAGCHGDALHGDEAREVPPLEGPAFITSWNGQPLADLIGKVQRTMPADAPGTLRPEDVAAVTAFVLRQNGVPDAAAPSAPPDTASVQARSIPDDPAALAGVVLRLPASAR